MVEKWKVSYYIKSHNFVLDSWKYRYQGHGYRLKNYSWTSNIDLENTVEPAIIPDIDKHWPLK